MSELLHKPPPLTEALVHEPPQTQPQTQTTAVSSLSDGDIVLAGGRICRIYYFTPTCILFLDYFKEQNTEKLFSDALFRLHTNVGAVETDGSYARNNTKEFNERIYADFTQSIRRLPDVSAPAVHSFHRELLKGHILAKIAGERDKVKRVATEVIHRNALHLHITQTLNSISGLLYAAAEKGLTAAHVCFGISYGCLTKDYGVTFTGRECSDGTHCRTEADYIAWLLKDKVPTDTSPLFLHAAVTVWLTERVKSLFPHFAVTAAAHSEGLPVMTIDTGIDTEDVLLCRNV